MSTLEAQIELQAIRIPSPRTRFVGRTRDVANVIELIGRAESCLVTLTGPGGVGKTRLAIEIARHLADDGTSVAFVPLANVVDPDLVISSISQAIYLTPVSGQDPAETLARHLSMHPCVLVLDNFEQVIDASTQIADLLDATSGLKIVITSRSLLKIAGEREYPVNGLEVPPESAIGQSPAVELFVDRAKMAVPNFELTTENSAAVARICARLDGLPLAIELAAAKLRLLSPGDLLRRLETGFGVLSTTQRDLPERQRTLENAIWWSYNLLTPGEQSMFRLLSIFSGGFSVEAAERVAVDVLGLHEGGAFELCEALVDQSLLRRIDGSDADARILMLQAIREFGLARLVESNQYEEVALAHTRYFAAGVAETKAVLKREGQFEWMGWFNRELDNIRAAVGTVLRRGDKREAYRLLAQVSDIWAGRYGPLELDRWLDAASALEGEVSDSEQFPFEFARAWVCTFQGRQDDAERIAKRALELAPSTEDGYSMVRMHNLLGGIALHRNDFDESRAHFSKSIEIAQSMPEGARITGPLHNLALVDMIQDRGAAAVDLFERARQLALDTGDVMGAAMSSMHIAPIEVSMGRLASARRRVRAALPILRSGHLELAVGECLAIEAAIEHLLGHEDVARRLAVSADALVRSIEVLDLQISTPFSRQFDELVSIYHIDKATPPPSKADVDELVAIVLAFPFLPEDDIRVPGNNPAVPDDDGLTNRERQIVRLLAMGKTNQEIADELFISLRTAQTHVSNILTKLKLTSRAAVAAYAVRHGIE